MSNGIICIDKRVKNSGYESGIPCLALIFKMSNPITTILHAKNLFKVARYDESL